MKGPRKFSADQVGNLARSLHKRQFLGFLQKSGYAIKPDLAPDQFQIRDAAGRAGSLEFPIDGSVRVTTASGLSVSKWFNSDGELRKIAASGGLETVISERGGERTIARRGFGEFAIRQNTLGELDRISYPDGTAAHFESGDDGTETYTDQSGNRTIARRAADGSLEAIINPDGHATHFLEMEDSGMKRISVIGAAGNRHDYTVDSQDRLAQWSVNGVLAGVFKGQSINGLPQRADYADGHWVEFATDKGRVTAARNANSEVLLSYDASGNIVSESQNGLVVSYERDATNLLTAIVLPGGERLSFAYDGDGRLSGATDWGGQTTAVSWAPSGQLSAIRHPNGITTSISSNALGLVTAIETKMRGGQDIAKLSLAHDACDRVVAIQDAGGSRQFTYDPVGRLTGVTSADPALAESFQLDGAGNRVADAAGVWRPDGENRVSGEGANAVGYDQFGRTVSVMTVKGRAALNYNGRGQVIAMRLGASVAIDFGYDAFGRRLWKRNGNEITRYLWVGDTLLCEWKEGAAAGWTRRDHLFLPGLYLPLAMRVDGEIYRQHTDHRLAPLALTGAGGNVVWSAKLKAFGEAIVQQNAVDNPWRLANQYCDPESGLHYNLARYCHPGLGRFLTPDPMFEPMVGGNLYLYAAGDPINYCDPTGELFFIPILIAIGVGLVVGAAINAGVKAYELRNQPWSDDKASQIRRAAVIGGVIGAVGGAIGAAAGLGVAAVITARAGVAAASGLGALIGIGAADGAVSSVVETCIEAKVYDKALTAGDVAFNALIGGGIGAVTAGIGGMVATRLMRRAIRKRAANLKVQNRGKNRVEMPSKRVDLDGKTHTLKDGTDVETPHTVDSNPPHPPGSGGEGRHPGYDRHKTRPTTNADLDEVEEYLKRGGK